VTARGVRSARAGLLLGVLGGAAAGSLMLLAASRPWAALAVRTPGVPAETVTVTGSDAAPLTAALALVVLAGSVAVLPTGGWVRRAVGVVVAVAAGLGGVLAFLADDQVRIALAEAVAASPAALGGGAPPTDVGLAWWRWLYVVAAAAGTVIAVTTAWRGQRWAVMGSRYDPPAATRRTTDEDPWRTLDAGRDPTT